MKKIYLGTNTKMFKTPSEAAEHISRLAELTEDLRDQMHLFVIPSFTSLPAAKAAAEGSNIRIGAQSVGWEDRGQYTGEISPLMLGELGVDLAMVGHSERRHVLHETDFEEEKRVACAAAHGMTVLLCIGETAEQKSYGLSREYLAAQLKIGLNSLSAEAAAKQLWIAYEPVWAIGVNGVPADEGYVEEIHGFIRETLCALYGDEIGYHIPVLYGGSVNPQNAEALIARRNVDGLFIGRSAWDAERFNGIIRSVLPVYVGKREEEARGWTK